jgi:hypothetical protein
MSRDQNVGRIRSTEIDIISFDRVEQFRYLRAIGRNQNSVQEEMKGILK